MTTISTSPPFTPADLQRLENEAGVEFVNGQILEKPVSIISNEVEARIQGILFHAAELSGLARVYGSGQGYKCYPEDPAKFRKPDVSLVSTDRLADVDRSDGFFHIPADLVVEVISTGDLADEVEEKVEEYLQHGFNTVWVVYVQSRILMVHRADGSVAKLRDSDSITLDPLLPSFSCKVADFFATRPE